MPRVSAAQRFAIWAAGFGVAAGLPLMALMHVGASASEGAIAGAGVAGNFAGPLLQLDARWGLVVVGLWAAASGSWSEPGSALDSAAAAVEGRPAGGDE